MCEMSSIPRNAIAANQNTVTKWGGDMNDLVFMTTVLAAISFAAVVVKMQLDKYNNQVQLHEPKPTNYANAITYYLKGLGHNVSWNQGLGWSNYQIQSYDTDELYYIQLAGSGPAETPEKIHILKVDFCVHNIEQHQLGVVDITEEEDPAKEAALLISGCEALVFA